MNSKEANGKIIGVKIGGVNVEEIDGITHLNPKPGDRLVFISNDGTTVGKVDVVAANPDIVKLKEKIDDIEKRLQELEKR